MNAEHGDGFTGMQPHEKDCSTCGSAAELAAGIDAWTGGWFQRARAPVPHP